MPVYKKGRFWRVVVYVGGIRKDLICRGTEEDARQLEQGTKADRLAALKRPDLWRRSPSPPRTRQTFLTIYFIQCGGASGPIKIGVAGNLAHRMQSMQTANPVALTLLASIPGRMMDERMLHHRFRHLKLRGEWFEPAADLLAFIREVSDIGQGLGKPNNGPDGE